MRARGEKDLFPVSRPTRVIGIVARHVFEDVHLSGRDLYHGHVTDVSRVARFFDGVKRDTSSIGRDRRENSIGDLFLAGAVEICDPDSLVAFESDVPIATKCCDGKAGEDESKKNYFFHGRASVTKKVAASATERTMR